MERREAVPERREVVVPAVVERREVVEVVEVVMVAPALVARRVVLVVVLALSKNEGEVATVSRKRAVCGNSSLATAW